MSTQEIGGGDARFPPDLAHHPRSSSSIHSLNQGDQSGNSHQQYQQTSYSISPSNQDPNSSSSSPNIHHLGGPPASSSSPHPPKLDSSSSFAPPQQEQHQQPGSVNGHQQSYADQLFFQQQRQQAQVQEHATSFTSSPNQQASPHHPPPPNLSISISNPNTPYPSQHLSAPNSGIPHDQRSSPPSPGAAASSFPQQTAPAPPAHPQQPPYHRSPASDPPPFSPMPGFPAVASLGGYPTGDGSSNAPPVIASPSSNTTQEERDRTLSSSSSAQGVPGGGGGGVGASLGAGREAGEKRTLWLGDLEAWMDEAYLRQMASLMGWDIVAIKLIRPAPQSNPNPVMGAVVNNGYCFLTFPTAHLASRILHTLTPTPTNPPILMPNSSRPFKANWASSSTSSTNPAAVNPAQMTDIPPEREYSIFVGDLAPEVGEGDLVKLFLDPPTRGEAEGGPRKSFTSTRSAKIMLDPGGGGSRGYGFVRFGEEADQLRALAEMQGVYCLSRPMRLSHATAKNKSGLGSQSGASVGGSSRGSTPIPPPVPYDHRTGSPSHLSPHHPNQNDFVSSPLQKQPYNPYEGLSPNGQGGGTNNATVSSPTSYVTSPSNQNFPPSSSGGNGFEQQQQQPQQQQQSSNPLPPPQRRLSANTIEYLTQLAAANGGTLPFGPGMTFPPLPMTNNQNPSSGGDQQRGDGRDQQQGMHASSSVPSLNIPESHDPRQSHFPNQQQQQQQRSRSPSSGISPSSSPFPPPSSSSLGQQGPSSSFTGGIQIPSNDRQQYQQQQQQHQQQQQRSDSIASMGSPLSPTAAFDINGQGGGMGVGVNSTDPNNTTVFVGGLSSLISEETLKTFFTPFGEITYVKIPPGKGCGFVQFVKKADAERAIERMQGFPIGGGRIRLSWGRSQYKAAQAAAHAAQLGLGIGALTGINGLTPAQAAQLGLALQGLGGLAPTSNGNLLRQLAAATATPGYSTRANVGAGGAGLGGLGGLNGLGGGGLGSPGFGGLGAGAGGLGGLGNLGGLAGLSAQNLQSLLALGGGGLGGGAGALNPALLARLSAQGGLAGFGPNDLGVPPDGGQLNDGGLSQNLPGVNNPHNYNPVGQSNFAPFSPAQSPISNSSNLPPSHLNTNGLTVDSSRRSDEYGRFDDRQHQQHQQHQHHQHQQDDETHDQFSSYSQQAGSSAPSERDVYLNSLYANGGSNSSTSPTASTRVPGSYSQSHPSAPSHLRSVTSPGSEVPPTSPFDPHYRTTAPPLQTSSSYSSDHSSRFFGAFSPPATAPGMAGSDYLQQQQLAPSRARAASASVASGGGIQDLVNDMDSLDVGAGGRVGSGRSFGYGSFGGAGLRSHLSGGGRYQGGERGRFEEGAGGGGQGL